MYNNEILIGAFNSETEPDRLVRLERVIGYICAQSEDFRDGDFLLKLSKLYDHKGFLTAYWLEAPSENELMIIKKAWCSPIGDGSDNIKHELISLPVKAIVE